MRKILLDTNAYSNLLFGNEDVLDSLARADVVYMSAVVLGELEAGFLGGRKKKRNLETLEKFLQNATVKTLAVTRETAHVFGKVKNELRIAGSPIPMNDLWIASQAIETGSVLITFDKHFDKVPGLRIWN